MSVINGSIIVNDFSSFEKRTNGVLFRDKRTSTIGNAYFLGAQFFNSPTLIAQNLGTTVVEDIFTLNKPFSICSATFIFEKEKKRYDFSNPNFDRRTFIRLKTNL